MDLYYRLPQGRRHRPVRRRCFTLMEMMIVLVIIGMVAGMVIPATIRHYEKARRRTAYGQIMAYYGCAKDYYLDTGEYPQKLEDLVTDPGNPKWDGPYVDPPKIRIDPWGEPYRCEVGGERDFGIYSYGKDRAPGGEKWDADITSWQ